MKSNLIFYSLSKVLTGGGGGKRVQETNTISQFFNSLNFHTRAEWVSSAFRKSGIVRFGCPKHPSGK